MGLQRVPSFSDRPGFPTGLRVLVIEPRTEDFSVIVSQLRECRYEVTGCQSESEAQKAIKEAQNEFDVMMFETSVLAQGTDGSASLLKSVGDASLILFGQNTSQAQKVLAIESGAVDLLDKPVSMLKLRNIWQHTVRKMMKKSEGSSSLESDREVVTVPAASRRPVRKVPSTVVRAVRRGADSTGSAMETGTQESTGSSQGKQGSGQPGVKHTNFPALRQGKGMHTRSASVALTQTTDANTDCCSKTALPAPAPGAPAAVPAPSFAAAAAPSAGGPQQVMQPWVAPVSGMMQYGLQGMPPPLPGCVWGLPMMPPPVPGLTGPPMMMPPNGMPAPHGMPMHMMSNDGAAHAAGHHSTPGIPSFPPMHESCMPADVGGGITVKSSATRASCWTTDACDDNGKKVDLLDLDELHDLDMFGLDADDDFVGIEDLGAHLLEDNETDHDVADVAHLVTNYPIKGNVDDDDHHHNADATTAATGEDSSTMLLEPGQHGGEDKPEAMCDDDLKALCKTPSFLDMLGSFGEGEAMAVRAQ